MNRIFCRYVKLFEKNKIAINRAISFVNNENANKCTPCPKKPKPQPKQVIAKTCTKCSFWEMQDAVCKGTYVPKKCIGKKCEPVCHFCVAKDLLKGAPDKDGVKAAICEAVELNSCGSIPECPKGNWSCH